jgi:hypothetical protein
MSTSPQTESTNRLVKPRLGPVLRDAVFDDYERVAALQARNGLPSKSREDWMALWTGNPAWRDAGGHAGGKWSIGLVLEAADGEIVGYIARIPVVFHFRGRRLRGAVTGSWVIDQQYRAYSMQVLNRVTQNVDQDDDVDLFVTDTAGAKAEPALRIFRWRRMPSGTWDRSFFWITGYRGFARSALLAKSIPHHGLLAYPAALALACHDFFRPPVRSRTKSLVVESCSGFDARFDAFWEKLLAQKRDVLISARSRETLDWHYRSQLARGDAWVLLVSRNGRPVAFAVFDRQDNPRLGLKRVRLVDFQAIDCAAGALDSALGWMLRRCRAAGIHVLESTGSLLESLGPPENVAPHQRNLDAWRYYYKATDEKLAEALQDAEAWAPSPYDGDTSL